MGSQDPRARARELAEVAGVRAVLVGEDNPHSSDPRYALWPYPPNCARHRLQDKVMGVSMREYITTFARVNLCAGRWGAVEAMATATRLLGEHGGAPLVLLGAKVAGAFGLDPREPFTTRVQLFATTPSGPVFRRVVLLPHPSGRSRAWNDEGAYHEARVALRAAGVLPP